MNNTITTNSLNLIEEKDVRLFCRTTLYRLRREGKLPYYRIGRRIFYTQGHLEALLESHEHRQAA